MGFISENLSHNGIELPEGFGIEGIINILSVAAVQDKPRFHEDFHIMGKGGLGHTEGLLQLSGALFLAGQHVHDFEPLRIGNGFQDFSGINVNFFHNSLQLLHRIISIIVLKSIR